MSRIMSPMENARLPIRRRISAHVRWSICLLGIAFAIPGRAAPDNMPAPHEAQTSPRLSDEGWSTEFNMPGLPRGGAGLINYRGELIVGGRILAAGKPDAVGVARWDGRAWRPLGSLDCESCPTSVWRMAVYHGDLIAAGAIYDTNYVPSIAIARWDGESWHPLGAGLRGSAYSGVTSMVVHDDRLVVGGWFNEAGGQPVRNIAAWDGKAWSPLDQGVEGVVQALAVYQDDLFAAEQFSWAGADSVWHRATRLLRREGSDWRPVPGAFEFARHGDINAMVEYQGRLVIGGNFSAYDGAPGTRLAAWDGTTWSDFDLEFTLRYHPSGVTSLLVRGSDLIVAGDFMTADSTVADLARWDGTTLSQLGPPLSVSCQDWSPNMPPPETIVSSIAELDGDLVVVGCFLRAGDLDVNNVARWDGRTWRAFGAGQGGRGGLGGIVHEGLLITYGPPGTDGARAFDGERWRSLGPGDSLWIDQAAVVDRELIASGWFPRQPNTVTSGTRKWAGREWTLIHEENPGALEVIDGQLYASYGNRVYRYTGGIWRELSGQFNGSIFALAGGDGVIYAGGYFTAVDGRPAYAVARWDGESWQPVGDGFSSVYEMAVCNGRLIVGGYLPGDAYPPILAISEWTDSGWVPLRNGLDPLASPYSGSLKDLAVFRGTLLAGGSFFRADGSHTGLAAWDGAEWYDFGKTLEGSVHQITTHGDDLYVFGNFMGVGGRPAFGIAHWSLTPDLSYGSRLENRPVLDLATPNPFRSGTLLSYSTPVRGHVRIVLFDIAGRHVVTLDEGLRAIGDHAVEWDGRDLRGALAPAGIYFARIEVDGALGGSAKLVKVR